MKWRVGLGWLLFSVLSPIALLMVAVMVGYATTGKWSDLALLEEVDYLPYLELVSAFSLWLLTIVWSIKDKRRVMKKELGLWIDHRKAVIVIVTRDGEEVKHIRSEMGEHVGFSAHSPEGSPEDQRDRRFANHLNHYYDEVIAAIRDADSILILGPGEAKGELEKQLAHEKLSGRIVGVETTDKLTEPQIVAKVHHYFLK